MADPEGFIGGSDKVNMDDIRAGEKRDQMRGFLAPIGGGEKWGMLRTPVHFP